jgi:hypothetical protein
MLLTVLCRSSQPFSRCSASPAAASLGEVHTTFQERAMTQQTGRHHLPIGVFVERALIAAAIIGIVVVLFVGFL